jgi:hypothetical protein
VRVVEPLEVIDVEQQQREWGAPAAARRKLALQAIIEGAAVVDARQTIANGGLVHADQRLLLQHVLERERERRATPEADPDSVRQERGGGDALARDEGAVRARAILDEEFGARRALSPKHSRVNPRETRIGNQHGGLLAAPEGQVVAFVDRDDAALQRAGEQREDAAVLLRRRTRHE